MIYATERELTLTRELLQERAESAQRELQICALRIQVGDLSRLHMAQAQGQMRALDAELKALPETWTAATKAAQSKGPRKPASNNGARRVAA